MATFWILDFGFLYRYELDDSHVSDSFSLKETTEFFLSCRCSAIYSVSRTSLYSRFVISPSVVLFFR